MSSSPSRGAGVLAVVLATSGFSFGFILAKLIGLPAPVIASWRLLIGGGTLAAVALAWRVPWPRAYRELVVAGIAFGGHQILYITATQSTTVAMVALVGATQPLLVAAASRRTVGEQVPPTLFWCSALAIAGVGVVVYANLDEQSRSLQGDLLSVVNLFVMTVYFFAAKRARMLGAHTLTLTAGVFGIALACVLPVALAVGMEVPGERQWLWLLLLALGSGNGHLLLNWAHRRITAALAALVLAAVPILAALWAHFFLDEPLGWRHVVGMVLVVGAIEVGRRADAAAAAESSAG